MIKWKAKSQYIDIETGEIISKRLASRDYVIIKTTKKAIKNGEYDGTIEYTRECERTRQQKLFQ